MADHFSPDATSVTFDLNPVWYALTNTQMAPLN